MKSSKIALYVVLLPVLVIVVASSIFLALFDANAYKQDLIDYVKQSSGRSLVFHGKPELMLYPDFGMKLGAMEFSNAPGFGKTPMLSVVEASISVNVKSVLQLEPKVSQLILSDLHIDLQKNKQGVTNWDDLIPEKAKQSQPKATSDTNNKNESQFELAGAFEGININNAKVSWKDASTGEEFAIDDLDFTTSEITPTEPFDLSLHLIMHKNTDILSEINLSTQVFFDLKTMMLSLQDLNLTLDAEGDLIPFEQTDVALLGNVKFDVEKQILKINQLSLKADIKDDSMPSGLLNSRIEAKQLHLQLEKRWIQLSQLQLGINSLQFDGDVTVSDYAKPAINFDLASQNVDLDELLGLNVATEEAAVENTQKTEEIDAEIILPNAFLRQLELQGQLSITRLKAMNILSENIALKVEANEGVVQMKPLSLDLYDGSLLHEMTIDARQDVSRYSLNTTLDKVQIGDLLVDFKQIDQLKGAANITLNANTKGTLLSQLKKNLQGEVSLRFADGALKGFNLRHLADTAKAKLSGDKKPKESIQETDFTELKLSGKIVDGIFMSDDLSLKSPLIRVGGHGQVDLNEDSLDYTVNAKIIGSLEGQSGEGLDASGLLVPVRIFGPFASLKTDILLDNMLKQEADKKLKAAKAALDAKKKAAAAALEAANQKKKAALKAELAKKKQEVDKKKAEQKKKVEALKAQQAKAKEAKQKELDEAKRKKEAEIAAKKKAEKEKAKAKAEEKLKSLFK